MRSRANVVVLATRNPGKVAEIASHLAELDLRVIPLSDIAPLLEIDENMDTFAGNAALKASIAREATGLAAMADDSGLEVDALGGMPGVRSARWGGPDLDDTRRNALLLSALRGVPAERRTARFRCALAFAEGNGGDPHVVEGVLAGRIAMAPAGTWGFGYDPIFVPVGHDRTLSELGPEIKSRISHRAQALADMKLWLASRPR